MTPEMMETKESLGSVPAPATPKSMPYIWQHTVTIPLMQELQI